MKKTSLLKTIIVAVYFVMGALSVPSLAQNNDFWEIEEGRELEIEFFAYNDTRLNIYIDITDIEDPRLISSISTAKFETDFDADSGKTTGTFTWTPAIGAAGEYYPIHIVVEDPATNFSDYQTIKITVLAAEDIIDFFSDEAAGEVPFEVNFTIETEAEFNSFEWSFGDDGTSTDENPSHTYTTVGTFDVMLTATLPGGGTRTVDKKGYISVYSVPPDANFSATPVSGPAPLAVDFDSDDSTGSIEMWLWKFGDGTTSTDPNPSHAYVSPGTYDVELSIVSFDGTLDSKKKTDYITVAEGPPNAHFTAEPRSGTGSLTVHFTDHSTGSIDMWSWDFDDDGVIDIYGSYEDDRNPTYTYNKPGIYNVTLIVSGEQGTDEQRRIGYIRVYGTPPTADFYADPLSGQEPLTVYFTDYSQGTVETWLWDFGDNMTSTEKNPTHLYKTADLYTVTLTVGGSGGSDTATRTDYINVSYAPIEADFEAVPIEGEIEDGVIKGLTPLAVSFTDTSSGNISAWLWNFGDGATGSTRNITHYYQSAGTYTVTLTVQGPGGSDVRVKTGLIVAYKPEPPQADFTASIRQGTIPLTVNFIDLSAGIVTAYLWNFGDGETSTQKNPSHTYGYSGNYNISLAVGGPGGTDMESKYAYIVVEENVGSSIAIISPQDNSTVSGSYITVAGIVSGNIDTVEVMMSAAGYPAEWQTAEMTGSGFTCDVEIPMTGGNISIIAMATDTKGHKIADSVRVTYGYARIIDLPNYYTTGNNDYYLTSIAVVQDILDLMRPDPDPAFPSADEIYEYGLQYNLPENGPIDELDPDGMKHALGHYDIYDTNGDITGFGNQLLGYNFHVFSMEGTPNGFAEYLKEIVHWMSWPVMKGNPFKSSGADAAEEPYVPVAVPLHADTEGYSRWILANGCAASIDPYEGKTASWKHGYDVNDVTVYGLYLTDPETEGIGENTYIASSALGDYLKPMPTAAISGKYGDGGETDEYAGKYVMVADPPEEDCDFNVNIAGPRVNGSTRALISMAEYINDAETDDHSRHLIDSALTVTLDESRSTAHFSTEASLSRLFRPGEDPDGGSAISWKDIIDPMLLADEDFRKSIEGASAREFIKVSRLDTKTDYYIIPFDKFVKGRFLSYAAIMVDARDGHFLQATYVREATRYIQIRKEKAKEKVVTRYPGLKDEDIKARLVWMPSGLGLSPFYPWWEVTAGEKRFYIAQD